jgi:hypothetical protein
MKAQKLNHMLAEKAMFSFELIVRKFKRLYSYISSGERVVNE